MLNLPFVRPLMNAAAPLMLASVAFAQEGEAARKRSAFWTADPAHYVSRFGVRPQDIAGYFEQCPYDPDADETITDEEREERLRNLVRVAPDDRHVLCDPWVYRDFWRRLGIHEPDDLSTWTAGVRLAESANRDLPDLW